MATADGRIRLARLLQLGFKLTLELHSDEMTRDITRLLRELLPQTLVPIDTTCHFWRVDSKIQKCLQSVTPVLFLSKVK